MFGRNDVAGKKKKQRIDPTWPQASDGEQPVTELLTDAQGALSPFGELTFPLEQVPYKHPVTKVNK